MNNKPIDFFFAPASIAIVGASPEKGKLSGIIIESLKGSGFNGKVFAINPKYTQVLGIPCLPSIQEIKGTVDIAIFCVPAKVIPHLLSEGAGSIKGAVIVSGGFAETGEEGKALEKEVKDISRRLGVRVIGPNCLGIYDTVSRLDTFFIPSERLKRPAKGGLSIISQSGSFAVTAMDELSREGIGVARVISYGNKADVNESDLLGFLSEDNATSVVALYIESIEDGQRFIETAKRCSLKKPLLAVKVGKMGAGASAARSHTGAMTGRYEIYRAAFRKAGIAEVSGYEELIDGCKALCLQARAKGKRVMIITDGGGMGVNIADAAAAGGLSVPGLDESVKEGIKDAFPPFFAAGNPMDLTGSVTNEQFALAFEKTMSEDFFDIAIIAALWGPPGLSDSLVSLLAQKAGEIKKPVVICSPGGAYARERDRLFRESGMPVYATPEAAVRAAKALAGRGHLQSKDNG
jgi:acyl-CoA synthetase (NDP forming)